MASKYIDNGTYAAGYTLSGAYASITIGPSGSIGGTGLIGGTIAAYTILNLGQIVASASGASGVELQAAGTIVNGSTSDTGASIAGAAGAAGNDGSPGGTGVSLSSGGIVNYGIVAGGVGGYAVYSFPADGAAGGTGISSSGGASVFNLGTVVGGSGANGAPAPSNTARCNSGTGGEGGTAISLSGGSIVNSGLVAGGGGGGGGLGFSFYSSGGTGGTGGTGVNPPSGDIINSGTITGGGGGAGGASSYQDATGGTGGTGGVGIRRLDGNLVNTGTIAGGYGGSGGSGLKYPGNQGGINYKYWTPGLGRGIGGAGGTGVSLSDGSIVNSGTITGGGGGSGGAGAYNNDTRGSNPGGGGPGGSGGAGIVLSTGGSVSNYGTITGGRGGPGGAGKGPGWTQSGPDGNGGDGIDTAGGMITNGSARTGGSAAVIEGFIGVSAAGVGSMSVTNYGTIAGTSGISVYFQSASDALVVEAGSTLVGAAVGGGGTLVLGAAGGAGTIAGLGSQYRGFGSYDVASSADWTFAGWNSLVVHGGTLTVAGALVNIGGLDGGLTLASDGQLTNRAAGTISSTVQAITDAGAGDATVINYGVISSSGGTSVLFQAASDLLVIKAGSVLIGTAVGGGGTLELGAGGGTGTLSGLGGHYTGFSDYAVASGADWAFAGSNALAKGAILSDLGSVVLDGSLLNNGDIGGGITLAAGSLLTNEASGTISSSGTAVVCGGGGTVINYGTINGTGAAVAFTGADGVLLIEAGSQLIGQVVGNGGTLEFGAGAGQGQISDLESHFVGFRVYDIASGADWALTGSNTIASGDSLIDHGGLVVAGRLLVDSNFTAGSVTTLTVASGTLAFSGTGDSFAGAIGGAGTLAFTGGNATLGASAVVTIAALALSGGATLRLGGGRTYGGRFTVSAGTVALGGNALDLTGHATFTGGAIEGVGVLSTIGSTMLRTLRLEDRVTWLNQGTVDETGDATLGNAGGGSATIVNQAGAIFDLAADTGIVVATGGSGSFINDGLLELTASGTGTIGAVMTDAGTIALAAGTLGFSAVGNRFAGAISGPGTLAFVGGRDTLDDGTRLTVSRVDVSGSKTVLVIDTDLAYARDWVQSGGTLVVAAGDMVTLSGAGDDLAGIISGAGTLVLRGTDALARLTLADTVAVESFGTVAATGQVTIGDATAAVARLVNEIGGVFDLAGNIGIGNGTGASTLVNAGLIEKTVGTGTSTIALAVTNAGSIEAAVGRLDLADAVGGTGTLVIASGATIDAAGSVGAGQTVEFGPSKSTLVIADPSGFKATLSGFGTTDRIDLATFAFGSNLKLSFAGQVLTVTDGAATARLTLFGSYVAAGFHDAKDGGGTLITYTPPPTPLPQLATSH